MFDPSYLDLPYIDVVKIVRQHERKPFKDAVPSAAKYWPIKTLYDPATETKIGWIFNIGKSYSSFLTVLYLDAGVQRVTVVGLFNREYEIHHKTRNA